MPTVDTVVASSERNFRRPLKSETYVFYGLLVLAAVTIGTILVLYVLNVLTPPRLAYAIMFDAGSTGSRMHIFQIRIQNGQYKLDNETYERVSPGLSDYGDNPQDGALSLKPLLEKALRIVPQSEYSSTGISLKATAGLRLLNEVQQTELMKNVRRIFARYPFRMEHDSVELMGGIDEGFFGWLTVAFLMERDLFSNKIAALDLGGGSTQVTFIPEETATLNMTEHIHEMRMPGGSRIEMYSHSYLRRGLMYGRKEILMKSATAINATEVTVTVESPCIHPAVAERDGIRWQYFDKSFTVRPHPEHLFSFERCYSHAKEVIQDRAIFKPNELHNREMFLMSYYFDRAVEAGLIDGDDDGKLLQVKDFKYRAEFECQNRSDNLITNEFLCVDLTYIYSLLHDGLGLLDSSNIWVVQKLQNSAVSWALGAALNGIHL